MSNWARKSPLAAGRTICVQRLRIVGGGRGVANANRRCRLLIGDRVAYLDREIVEDRPRFDALDAFDADVPNHERVERPGRPGQHEQEGRGSQREFHRGNFYPARSLLMSL